MRINREILSILLKKETENTGFDSFRLPIANFRIDQVALTLYLLGSEVSCTTVGGEGGIKFDSANCDPRRKKIVSGAGGMTKKIFSSGIIFLGYKSNFQKSGGGGHMPPSSPGSYGTIGRG